MKQRTKKWLISLSAVVLALLLGTSSSLPFSIVNHASARPVAIAGDLPSTYVTSREVYVRNGNTIDDEYGMTEYNGLPVKYRKVTIYPKTSDSGRAYSIGKITVSKDTAFKAGYLNLLRIAVKWTTKSKTAALARTFYAAYKDVNSISSGFSASTTIQNANAYMLTTANLKTVDVYIYWRGVWRKAFHGETLYGDCSVACTATISGLPQIFSNKLSYSVGSTSCNIPSVCKNRIEKGGYSSTKAESIEIECAGKTVTVKPPYVMNVNAGMKLFPSSEPVEYY